MSRLEKNYTRLSEISGGAVEIGRKNKTTTIVFDMHALPDWVEKDQIGVNLPAIHRRCRLAGIDELHVSLASGKQSEVTPTIVGRNADSTAILGRRARIKKVPTYTSTVSGNESKNLIGARWAHVNVEMNFSEMEQRIRERSKPIRSPKEWSQEMNTAVQEAIVKKGVEHLIFSINRLDVFASLMYGGIGTYSGMGGRVGALPMILAEYALMNGMYNVMYRSLKYPKPYRWSLFLGPQMDRAAVLYTQKELEQLTGRQTLIRAFPSKES